MGPGATGPVSAAAPSGEAIVSSGDWHESVRGDARRGPTAPARLLPPGDRDATLAHDPDTFLTSGVTTLAASRPGTRRPALALAALAPLAVLAGAAVACQDTWDELQAPSATDAGQAVPVVFVVDGPVTQLPEEEAAALAWLRRQPGYAAQVVPVADLPEVPVPDGAVLWWHRGSVVGLPSAAVSAAVLETVREHLRGGGGMLLTLLATPYAVPLGLETSPPTDVALTPTAQLPLHDAARPLVGLQTRGHPLLAPARDGTYTGLLRSPRRYAVSLYGPGAWPARGKVWAVLRGNGVVDPELKPGIEYPPDAERRGRVVLLGAACYFATPDDPQRPQLEALVDEALRYVAVDSDEPAEHWEPVTERVVAYAPIVGAAVAPATGEPVLDAVAAARSGLALARDDPGEIAFDLSAPRIRATGRQGGRLTELWAPPFRVLRDLRFGLVEEDGDIDWFDATAAQRTFTARPEGDTITVRAPGKRAALHLALARDAPALLALVQVDAPRPARVVAAWRVDDTGAGAPASTSAGDLYLGWDPTAAAAVWRDRSGRLTALAGFGRGQPILLGATAGTLAAPAAAGRPAPSVDSPPAPGDPLPGHVVAVQAELRAAERVLPFVVAGGTDGLPALRQAWARALQDPGSVWAANASHYRDFLASTLDVQTPDPTFDEAFRWAKVGLESLRASVPGLGPGIVGRAPPSTLSRSPPQPASAGAEGAEATEPAYLAVDAVWAAMAADGYGDPALAADSLRLLARHQDLDGRIAGRVSAGGTTHHGAADATAFFLIAVEHHVRVSGDRVLLRELWPAARRAAELLLATDGNGDGLPDARKWGRPTIDGAPQGTATLHETASWAGALGAAGRLAAWAGDEPFEERCSEAAEQLVTALDERFWDPERRAFFDVLGAGEAGHLGTPTAALPMYLGLLEPGKYAPVADLLASAELSTDWGIRALQRSSTLYEPAHPRRGAVSPLLTGWTALAEYAHRRPLPGFVHLASLLRLVRFRNLGYVGDALHGERFRPVGPISHQAHAAALAIGPVVEGLLGIRADAMAGTLSFVPQLPGGWTHIVASPVRVGDSAFRLAMARRAESTEVTIERLAGTVAIQIEVGVPVPREVPVSVDRDASSGVVIREETVVGSASDHTAVVRLAMTANRAGVLFRHGAFPEAMPVVPSPEPGEPSRGLRLLQASYRLGTLVVRLEGLPGQRYRLPIATPWPVTAVEGVPGARLLRSGPGRALVELAIPGSGPDHQRAELTVRF